MGVFRLGFVASFLSHPVISGFITAAGILIAASQLRHLLGAPISGKTLPQVIPSLFRNLGNISILTAFFSACAGVSDLVAQGAGARLAALRGQA
jgi:sulfate permease, SulP family